MQKQEIYQPLKKADYDFLQLYVSSWHILGQVLSRSVKKVFQFIDIINDDLTAFDINMFLGLEIAEGTNEGLCGCTNVLRDIFPGDFYWACLFF